MCSLSVFSQVQYGVEAGYVINNFDATNVEFKTKPSFRIGGFVRYDTDVESGIYFSRRGVSLTSFIPRYADKIESIDFYGNFVELLPLSVDLISNKKLITDKLSISVNVGFYGSYCFEAKGNVVIDGEKAELKNVFKDTELTINGEKYTFKGFRPFDFGVSTGFKFLLFDKYFFRTNIPLSFINLTRYDKSIQYYGFNLSFGYMF
jgi:hypothetical protein